MMRRESGFTLVELLITMAILGFVLAGITQMFTGVLTQFKQQSRIAETSIEGIVGLELLRQDMEDAGFGLPWRIPPGMPEYAEASAATAYNDSPANPPRAFVAGSGTGWQAPNEGNGAGSQGSDVLVIKATIIARNNASQKWTHINSAGVLKVWDVPAEDLASANSVTNSVIVISSGESGATRRALVTDGSNNWLATAGTTSNFTPNSGYNFVYGIANVSTARMPFNRADYYLVSRTSTTVPARCAPNTSVLSKNVINNTTGPGGGNRADNLPLLDCVADMQVVFRLDTTVPPDGIDGSTDVLPAASLDAAAQIRNQVKEVRVYILAHEGQMDRSYTHPTAIICVGEPVGALCSNGRFFNVGANVNYRWKLYTLVVKPKNLW